MTRQAGEEAMRRRVDAFLKTREMPIWRQLFFPESRPDHR
jgi:hypothetical protein